ncbi:MAG: OsmC family protein [Candidatus Bathyarchaeum tardum]|nr:MAG: OsmC family protein [Candidatus Bathyarchaeum tardum]
MTEKSIVTKLQLVDNYQFNTEFDVEYLPNIILDEIIPDGEGAGPNPPRLLSAAVGHCMSTSLVYCLKKARVQIKDIQTKVTTNLYRNDQKKIRIKSIDLEIQLEVNEEDKHRVPRCLKLFEDYCTVTQSIRNGVEINVDIK